MISSSATSSSPGPWPPSPSGGAANGADLASTIDGLVAELAALAEAYEQAGLLGGEADFYSGERTPAAMAFIGGRDEALALRRSLLLISGLLRNVVGQYLLGGRAAGSPRHIAVFGGTQVGKSTVVNVLAGHEAARVHHTAGFTRHAQGFLPPGIEQGAALRALPLAFRSFTQVPQAALVLDAPQQFSIEPMRQAPAIKGTVLWDAPDCDAVGAAGYLRGLVEAVTLADCVVYVTSREKYAVNSILDWIVLLQEAGCPVTGCLNMAPLAQQRDILQSQAEALRRVAACHVQPGAEPAAAPPTMTALEYVMHGDFSILMGPEYAPAEQLRAHADQLAQQGTDALPRRARTATAFCQRHLAQALAPARAELDAAAAWEAAMGEALAAFSRDYQENYLDDPRRYDAFALVGVEILALLNPPIPGLQKAITAVRSTLALPARLIIAGTKALWRRLTQTPEQQAARLNAVSNEVQTFRQAHETLLNSLARTIEKQRSQPRHHPFWDALERQWAVQVEGMHEEFRVRLAAHRARTEEWIKVTAQAIYKELAKDPVKLNMLRGGRLAADAGAIIISLKTGGQGDIIHELVVAPALLSLVEGVSQHLTENYVTTKRQELRERLMTDTREFARVVYGTRLQALAQGALDDSGFLDVDAAVIDIIEARLADVARAVESKAAA